MTRIVIIVDEKGVYQSTLADSEADVRVLRREEDDSLIEEAESQLDEIEECP